MTIRNENYLRFVIIDFYPISIRVLEIDLPDTVHAEGHRIFFAGPVFEGHMALVQHFDEFGNRRHTEAEVGILIVRGFGFGA